MEDSSTKIQVENIVSPEQISPPDSVLQAIGKSYIKNFQDSQNAGNPLLFEESSWLIKKSDIKNLTKSKYDYLHVFLASTALPSAGGKIVLTLVVVPVHNSKNCPYGGMVTDAVLPCPKCLDGTKVVPYKYTDLEWD